MKHVTQLVLILALLAGLALLPVLTGCSTSEGPAPSSTPPAAGATKPQPANNTSSQVPAPAATQPEPSAAASSSFGSKRLSGDGVGQSAPELTGTDVDGKPFDLADYKGKVLILDFWATWCGPCRSEIPDFVKLQQKYGDQGLQIIGLSLDSDESALTSFVKQEKMNYPVVMVDDKATDLYGGVQAIPTTFIVDRQGVVKKRLVGVDPRFSFEDTIKDLL